MPDNANPAPPAPNTAYASLVSHPDDLIGLIAYALYRQSGSQEALTTSFLLEREQRHLPPTEMAAYRGEAERRLKAFATAAIEGATPDIIRQAIGDATSDLEETLIAAVNAAVSDLTNTVRRQTSLQVAVGTNLVAWVISLAVTILVVTAFYLPNWETGIVNRLAAVIHGAADAKH